MLFTWIMKMFRKISLILVMVSSFLPSTVSATAIWVGINEGYGSKINRYDLSGNYAGSISLGDAYNLNKPLSMARVGTEVWVGIEGYDQQINRYDLSGNYAGSISLGDAIYNPLSMVLVSTVPVPPTFFLFTSGLLVLYSTKRIHNKVN
jgi:hypothetical protein